MGDSPALPTDQASTTTESASAINEFYGETQRLAKIISSKKRTPQINCTKRPIFIGDVEAEPLSLAGAYFLLHFFAGIREKALIFQHSLAPRAQLRAAPGLLIPG
jgi:hypothetical protein